MTDHATQRRARTNPAAETIRAGPLTTHFLVDGPGL
jgi:hypothetical protein